MAHKPKQTLVGEGFGQLRPEEELGHLSPEEDLGHLTPDEDIGQLDPEGDLGHLAPHLADAPSDAEVQRRPSPIGRLSRTALRRAIIMKEILGPPVSLQSPDDSLGRGHGGS